jgi:uncharacterized membrane protein
MTASRSNRARNARRAGATQRTGSGNPGRADTVVKSTPAKGPAAKSTAVRNGNGSRNGGRAETATVSKGAPQRVSRRQPVQEEAAEAAPRTGPALWMQLTTFALALAGLGVSTYLTVAHFTESTLAGCGETKGLVDCTKVTTSPQSYVFGIPVAVLGLAFFMAAVALMSPWAWRWASREVALIRIASLVVGVGFVLYLIYAELFIIGAICLYCTSVHAITFLLFVLTVFAAAAWGLPARQRS